MVLGSFTQENANMSSAVSHKSDFTLEQLAGDSALILNVIQDNQTLQRSFIWIKNEPDADLTAAMTMTGSL